MTITKNIFAKSASVVAGLALVLSTGAITPAHAQTTTSLQAQIQALLAQVAALQAQLGGGVTTPSVQFTRDLTIGSTGADVTSLQNWLIAGGYSIPAGATGYFGVQTQTALARYQAANSISPAAGYFGPITRTRVNATVVTPPITTPPPTTPGGALRGGEADLFDFDLIAEAGFGNESERDVEVATAEFDVEGGDIRVERLELMVQATGSGNSQPWRYFDRITLWADGDEIGDMDVDSRSDWRSVSGGYRLTFTGLDYVVREGDMAEITIAADIASVIRAADVDQEFDFWIPTNGIRATDADGIQQYIGDNSDRVEFAFDGELTGDLSVRANSDDPSASVLVADADRESSAYTVFMFDLENDEDVDTLITDLTIDVEDLAGGVDADDVIRRATLRADGRSFTADIESDRLVFEDMDFEIDGDDTVEFELSVTLIRNAVNTSISFVVRGSEIEAESVDTGAISTVSGTVDSATHTIALSGAAVEAVSTTATLVTSNNDERGSYTIRFDVTAFEEDAFIFAGAASTTAGSLSSGNGVQYRILTSETWAGSDTSNLTSTATRSGNYFRVREGRTETFTLSVSLNPNNPGFYAVELAGIGFNETSAPADAWFTADANNQNFETRAINIAGN